MLHSWLTEWLAWLAHGSNTKLMLIACFVNDTAQFCLDYRLRFPCGRWLGSSIDDGSAERLLVGQLVPRTIDSEELIETCKTPPRARSPSIHRPEIRPSEIQHMLGDCVNAIVKWHYRSNRDKDSSTLTNLLCGEDGLVKCMESAFLYGFKSQRLFGRNFFIWDFLGKCPLMTVSIDSNLIVLHTLIWHTHTQNYRKSQRTIRIESSRRGNGTDRWQFQFTPRICCRLALL